MNAAKTVTPSQLMEFLLNVAVVRPVFIWGPPGIGNPESRETTSSDRA